MRNYSKQTMAMMQNSDMMKMMMKNLPPEQRKQMEARLKSIDQKKKAPKIKFKKVGKSKIGKYKCTLYHGFRGKEKVQEMCTVKMESLGFKKSDFKHFERIGREYTMDEIDSSSEIWKNAPKMGWPINIKYFENKKLIQSVSFKDIKNKKLSDSIFMVVLAVG